MQLPDLFSGGTGRIRSTRYNFETRHVPMSERLRRSLKSLIWPLMRLMIWLIAMTAILVALELGHELLVALTVVGGAASVAHPIARWIQNATGIAPQIQPPTSGTAG